MPKYIHLLIIYLLVNTFLASHINAQLDDEKFYYGFQAGASITSINEVSTTLIRPIFPVSSYKTTIKPHVGFTAGSFIYYRFRNSKFAIQPEISYADLGGSFLYVDVEDLSYEISFRYNYLNISPVVKFYMAHGMHISVGPQLSLIIDRSKLKYTSNQPELGPDLQIQQSLREVLKGNSMAGFTFGLGYDMPMGLNVNLKYYLGISDAIETLANGFYFIENKNITSGYQITVGYHIPFFK